MKAAVALVAVLGSSLAGGCGDPVALGMATAIQAQPLVGGEPIDAETWPSVGWLAPSCSATLVHPRLLLYAAHCGTSFSEVWFGPDVEPAALSRCESHPDAGLGNGRDIAFCVLSNPVESRSIVPLLRGCELPRVTQGSQATLVGFGQPDAPHKRQVSVELSDVGQEFRSDDSGSGVCDGDSGGPAFAKLDVGGWRQIGVISAKRAADDCGTGPSWYVPIPAVSQWLEQASNFDITPCETAEQWAPTPRCRDLTSSEAVMGGSEPMTQLSDSCGPPFAPETPDADAPEIVSIKTVSLGPAHWVLDVEARDTGWGLAYVEATESGGSRVQDEVPPYSLPLAGAAAQVLVRAVDLAGNQATVTVQLLTARSGSCNLGLARPSAPAGLWPLMVFALATRRRHRPAKARAIGGQGFAW